MAWLNNNNNNSNAQIYNTFASLGVRYGDTYNVNESCLQILEDILRKLAIEDRTLRTFRRAIGFGENIKKDLIPLLIYVKDDTEKITDATKIIDTTIKILVDLTVPVECLLSIESVSRTDVGRHTIFELNRLLTTSKEAFADSRSTKAVMDHMRHVVERDVHLNVQQCDSINNCLLLLRNILHIPENRTTTTIISNCPLAHSSMQNVIIWNLFTQSVDKIIIYLMTCPQKMYWGVTMVQLIALMYKDQHVGTLQKLLNLWLEASLSDSSEDNESNTSPPPPDQGSGDSSPTITSSDPTSDSSDNGGSGTSNERAKNTNQTDNLSRNKNNTTEVVRAAQNRSKALIGMKRIKSTETETSTSSGVSMSQSSDTSGSIKTPIEKCDNGNNLQCTNNMKKHECPSSHSEVSDCGYATQVENQESISTSSNDDDHQPQQKKHIHQKPHTFQKSRYNNNKNRTTTATLDKKELRRKKLVKRSKTHIINMKGLMHHTPTDEDISNILKEFTVDFLLKGYGNLVQILHSQLLTNYHQLQIDTSHFFWLVTYFLKFATQLELELEHVSPVLSIEIISYLIYQGVWLYEEFEILSKVDETDLKPCLRRLHLVVTAIREFIQALETYQKMLHLNDDDRINLMTLQKQIGQMEDLKCLFVLLLRQYNSNIQTKQYLQDLIVTNHNYLLLMDQILKDERNHSNQLMDHLKQFATVEVMHQYGQLLENFKENGEYVNNCIFTMMHHIGGDLEHISTLFQPTILKSFSLIWETDYEICDDWSDLIEYVIHKFINSPKSNDCTTSKSIIYEEQQENFNLIQTLDTRESSKRENDKLFKKPPDTISNITRRNDDNIASIKYKKSQTSFGNCRSNKELINTREENSTNGDVSQLKEHLCKENKGHLLHWLQRIVIEACYVKLILSSILKDVKHAMEPSIYYFTLLNLPIPLVPWTIEQDNILKHQPFVLLLHKLGFYLPADTGKIFVRIPNFWTAEYLFNIAQQLGPIDEGKLKFNINVLDGISNVTEPNRQFENVSSINMNDTKFSLMANHVTPSLARYTPLPNSSDRIKNILQSKVTPLINTSLRLNSESELSVTIPVDEEVTIYDINLTELDLREETSETSAVLNHDVTSTMVISPTDDLQIILNDNGRSNSGGTSDDGSVTSDLTRMCVSDEDEKLSF